MKTIKILDTGEVMSDVDLTNEEKVSVGNFLFDQEEQDNDGQILFYTGIYYEEE